MPEIRECIASYLYLVIFLNHCLKNDLDLTLKGLWADASNKSTESKLAKGKVYKLEATSTVKRGSMKAQTYLWPEMWRITRSNPNPPSIETLTLKGVSHTNRAIILDFGALHFQLAYLTHTSIQIFTRKAWEELVLDSLKETRGYCIGLALEFQDYVIAFLTIDQVFQPHWAETREKLPAPPCDVYASYSNFLHEIAEWIHDRTLKDRSGFACEAIRIKGSKSWGGVGVYTVCELFFDAGLSPFLTEQEVFDSPSRTARLCEALWSYAHRSHTNLKSLMEPATKDGLLAPSMQHRLKYASWLHIYAKQRANLSRRQIALWDKYHSKLDEIEQDTAKQYLRSDVELYDIFEPSFIRSALEEKELTLGPLIFGPEKWAALTAELNLPGSAVSDPLTAMFIERGLISQPTHLSGYDELFVDLNSRLSWKNTYTYRAAKQIWSTSRAFPDNLLLDLNIENNNITPITGDQRKSMLFKYIVTKTNKVAIGPLEYCGNGTVVRTTHSKTLVYPIRAPRDEIIRYYSSQSNEQAPSESDVDTIELSPDNQGDSESELFTCPDDYTSSGSTYDQAQDDADEDRDEGDDYEEDFFQLQSFPTSSRYRSRSPSHKSDFSMYSSGESNMEKSDADNNLDEELTRIKRRKVHMTADRELAERGKEVLAEAGPSEDVQHDQRPRRSGGAKEVFYGRSKRQYNKKT